MLSASGLLTFSQLLLQIINKVLRTFLCEEFARFIGNVRFWQRVLSSSRWASVMIGSSIARSYTLAFSRILSIIFDACAFQIVVERVGHAGLLAQGLQIRCLRTGHRIIAREPLVRIFLGGTAFQQTRGWAVSDRDVTHSDLVEIAKRNGDLRKN